MLRAWSKKKEKKDEEVPWGCCPYFQDFSAVIASSNSGKCGCGGTVKWGYTQALSVKKLENTTHLAEVEKIQFRRGLKSVWVKLYHLQGEGLGGKKRRHPDITPPTDATTSPGVLGKQRRVSSTSVKQSDMEFKQSCVEMIFLDILLLRQLKYNLIRNVTIFLPF